MANRYKWSRCRGSGAGDLTAQPAQLFFVAFVLPPAPPSQSPMAEPGLMCPPWRGPSPRSTLCPWQVAALLVLFPACLLWPAHVTCCDWSLGRVSITALPSKPPGPLCTPLFFVVPWCPQLARLTVSRAFLDIFFCWLLLVSVGPKPSAGVTSNFTQNCLDTKVKRCRSVNTV